MMLENFIYAKQKSLFEEKLNNGEVLDEAIVFIEDTKEIWNHGTYFDGSKVDLSNIEASILNLINNKLDNISDLEIIRNGAAKGATALQALDLNNYALSVSGLINNINSSMNSVSSEVSNIKRIAEDARTKAANNESAISQCATKHELNTAVANLVDSAPETLNTLNELATAITEHQNVTDALDSAITNKADKTELPTKISLLENDAPYAIDDLVNNGLYIYDIDGKFTLPDNWDTANNSKAVGVAILTDDCKFVVAKEDAKSSYVYWGSFGTDISTLTNYTDAALAATDFDGVNNTSKIISAIGNTNDGYRDGTAAGDCAAYTFPNGKTGYLGAAGEWQVARQNKEDLNSALTLIGGTTMEESAYWTSTKYSSFDAWIQWFSSSSDLHDSSKARSGRYGRAFLALERPKPLKERVSDLESNKQDKLVSGTNIKTINNQSVLGSGNITISGGGSSEPYVLDIPSLVSSFGGESDDMGNVQCSGTVTSQKMSEIITAANNNNLVIKNEYFQYHNYDIQYRFDEDDEIVDINVNGNPFIIEVGYAPCSEIISISLNVTTSEAYLLRSYSPISGKSISYEDDASFLILMPNTYHIVTEESPTDIYVYVLLSFIPHFMEEYFVEFTTSSSGTTVSLPSTIKWANGEIPIFEPSTTYQISIVNNLGVVQKFK